MLVVEGEGEKTQLSCFRCLFILREREKNVQRSFRDVQVFWCLFVKHIGVEEQNLLYKVHSTRSQSVKALMLRLQDKYRIFIQACLMSSQ